MTEDEISLDMNDLMIEEIEWIEEKLDMGLSGVGKMLGDPDARQSRALRVLAAMGHRRKHPELTMEECYERAGKLRLSLVSTPLPPTPDNDSAPSSPLSGITA